jgi:hypothetical protein
MGVHAQDGHYMVRSMPYGVADHEWVRLKGEAWKILVGHAKRRSLIAYSDLLAGLTDQPFEPQEARFHGLLGELSTEEDEAGRGLLTVLVVHKAGDNRPGPGFFELAKSRGRNVIDIDKTWLEELDRVFDYWREN